MLSENRRRRTPAQTSNELPVGIAAGVITRDLTREHRVATSSEACTCYIDTCTDAPFGGINTSNMARKNPMTTNESSSQRISVCMRTGDMKVPGL